jgi:hypothetical protein
LKEGDCIICVVTIGCVPEELSIREKFIYKLTHRQTKTAEQMYKSDSPVPDWFLSGMEAVKAAPSAVNRQPVMFEYKDNNVTAAVRDIAIEGLALDLGIAKLHFEIGAGSGTWDFGNGARFIKTCEQIHDHQ